MKKKIWIILGFFLSLCGCAAQQESQETSKEVVEAKATKQELPDFVEVYLEPDYLEEYYRSFYHQIRLANEEFQALSKEVETHNQEIKEKILLWSEQEKNQDFNMEITVNLMRSDENVFSFVKEGVKSKDGEEEVLGRGCYNYDTKSGSLLNLEDVVLDLPAFYDMLELEHEEDVSVNWILSTHSVIVYESGKAPKEILYEENNALFQPSYFYPSEARVESIIPAVVTVFGDNTIKATIEQKEEENIFDLNIQWNQQRSTFFGIHGMFDNAYIRREEDRYNLYVENLMENDYRSIHIFSLGENNIEKITVLECHFSEGVFFHPDSILLLSYMDTLGSGSGYKIYQINKEGVPVSRENSYTLINGATIKSTRSLPVIFYDEVGEEEKEYLEAGTEFKLLRTDEDTFVEVALPDGRVGDLRFERKDYSIYIEGVEQWECFEYLPYAG